MVWNPLGTSALVVLIILNVINILIATCFVYKLIRTGKWTSLQICGVIALVLTLLMTTSRYIFNDIFYSFLAGARPISHLVAILVPNTLLRVFQYVSLLHFMYLVSLAPMIKSPSIVYVGFHYLCAIIAPVAAIAFYLVGFVQTFFPNSWLYLAPGLLLLYHS